MFAVGISISIIYNKSLLPNQTEIRTISPELGGGAVVKRLKHWSCN